MKLLFDANLSWKLSAKLKEHFTDCQHVDHLGFPPPLQDHEIWNFAASNGFMIVTNDEDFLNLVNMKGFPPKVVLLKTGNQSTNFIEGLLIKHKSDIASLHTAKDYGVIELY